MNSQERSKNGIITISKQLWVKYESKIVLTIGMILVAILSFEAGVLKGQNWQQKPLIIEKPVITQDIAQESQNKPPQTQNLALEGQNTLETDKVTPLNCAFVGSKNSNKYHLPTCQWAKRIKPENVVCFSSVEDAVAKGYQPDKTCIK
jgi:hypothetical protein